VTDRPPDLEMSAAARVGELRLECRPQISVLVYANVEAEAESVSLRENLPDRLEPGVSYLDGAVRPRLAAWLGSRS
jgi:hypothetical protein